MFLLDYVRYHPKKRMEIHDGNNVRILFLLRTPLTLIHTTQDPSVCDKCTVSLANHPLDIPQVRPTHKARTQKQTTTRARAPLTSHHIRSWSWGDPCRGRRVVKCFRRRKIRNGKFKPTSRPQHGCNESRTRRWNAHVRFHHYRGLPLRRRMCPRRSHRWMAHLRYKCYDQRTDIVAWILDRYCCF